MSPATNLELKPFRVEHVREMALTDRALHALLSVQHYERGLLHYEKHPGYTAFLDGVPVWAGGIVMLWPGVAEIWVIPTRHVFTHKKTFQKCFRRMRDSLLPALKIRRLQAEVQVDFEAGRRWAESLGFVSEGEMPKFGPNGETFVRYVYFPPES